VFVDKESKEKEDQEEKRARGVNWEDNELVIAGGNQSRPGRPLQRK